MGIMDDGIRGGITAALEGKFGERLDGFTKACGDLLTGIKALSTGISTTGEKMAAMGDKMDRLTRALEAYRGEKK